MPLPSTPTRSARSKLGLSELHFRDLRHAEATWLAISGPTTRELIARVDHASPAAALRYQHATEERDVALAQALSALATVAEAAPPPQAQSACPSLAELQTRLRSC